MQTILLLKIIAAPVLILGVTLLVRRFGPAVGGLVMGTPLVTGPISMFTALEQGASFASHAAIANLVGQVSGCLFCFAYACAARRFGAWASAACGVLSFSIATLAWNEIDWNLTGAIVLLAASLCILIRIFPRMPALDLARIAPWWELPARMVVASCFVLAMSAVTEHLGAQLSGLITPFPVFVLILVVFTHLHCGANAAAAMMRGVVLGSPAFGAFFSIVALGLANGSLVATYIGAALASIGASGIVYLLVCKPTRR